MISPNTVDALNYSELGYSDMGDSFEDMKRRAADKGFPFVENKYLGRYY